MPTSQPDWATSRPICRPRRPTATPLCPIVQHHVETFLARASESDPLGHGVPAWVERDFRAYLRCGILAHGFARARYGDCGRFHEATRLDEVHWLDLQRVVQRRVLRHFRTHGLLDEADAEGMLSWQGSGGFSIDAAVRIPGDDRAGVERGCSTAFPSPRPTGAPMSSSPPSSSSSASPGSSRRPACIVTDTTACSPPTLEPDQQSSLSAGPRRSRPHPCTPYPPNR